MKIRLTYEQICELINIAIATARIEKLILPHKSIRPFMHMILYGSIGAGKSELMNMVCHKLNVRPVFNISSASILGSVDKQTGIPIFPVTWENRNSILPIDEFNASKENRRSSLNDLLSLLENPTFDKRINYRINDVSEKDKDLYCKISAGKISIKTRFVLFMNTMLNMSQRQLMPELEALRTRCLLIPFYPNIEDLLKLAHGEWSYKYKIYKVKKQVRITKQVYDKIINLVSEAKISQENFLRTIGDICRTYAVIGWNEDMFKLILSLKQ